jgi:hypothetical protein
MTLAVKPVNDFKSIALCCDKPSAMQLNNTSRLFNAKKLIASLHLMRLLS